VSSALKGGGVAAAALLAAPALAQVQPHAGMLRYPDVGRTHIAFVYANDIWLVPRDGGTASPLASPPGAEQFPRFSPDDQTIAFVGNYDGNRDLYTIPVSGGLPLRITHHPTAETLCDWSPDGRLIFHSNALAGLGRQAQLFTTASGGGLPAKLPVPYGTFGAISPDGTWLAYTPHTADFRTWKRYRGGMATDIWLFNLKDNSARRITDWEGTDTSPMWAGSKLIYLSDAGEEHRLNLWSFDPSNNSRQQLTRFTEFDIKWPSIGPGPRGSNRGEVIFQNGAKLYLFDLASSQSREVSVTIPGARPTLRPKAVDASKFATFWNISPSGKRAVVEARGDIWSLPAEKGSPRNLTRTSGAAERLPAWSPDGRWIAYHSDATGEYELFITQSDGRGETRPLTSGSTGGFSFAPYWSPDSKRIVWPENSGALKLHTIESGETRVIDTDPSAWTSAAQWASWSNDSRWIAYEKLGEKALTVSIWVYDTTSGETRQLTSETFNAGTPVFDRKGDWLYFASNRVFNPMYSDIDTTFIYNQSEVLLAAPLRAQIKSPWAPRSDEEKWDDKKKDEEKKKENGEGKADDTKDGDAAAAEGEGGKDEGENGEGDENGKKNDDAKRKEAPAQDDGVSGTWEGTLTGPEPLPPGGVAFTLTLTLKEGNAVEGSFVIPMGTATLEGTYDPSSGTITGSFTADDGTTWSMTATITGEAITGSATNNQLGLQASFSGKRTARAAASDGKDGDAAKDETEETGESKKPRKEVVIDFDGFEQRAMPLPVPAGSFGMMAVNDKGALIYVRHGVGPGQTPDLKLFDIHDEKKEEKTVASGAGNFEISADGKKLLVLRGGSGGAQIQDASAGATGKPVITAGMETPINPRDEWKQMLIEAWRIERDFFYDPTMHGVDWPAVRTQYEAMLADAASREDLSYIISEMISELNVGHAYYFGGDVEGEPSVSVGLLGVDWELVDGAYRIARIITGGPWDSDARGPLSQPGVEVSEGDFVHAVNGVPLDPAKDPWAAFQGLAGKTVTLLVSDKPVIELEKAYADDAAADEAADDDGASEGDDGARDADAKSNNKTGVRQVVVELRGFEGDLRYREWIEKNRRYVEERSGGKLGYIHVPDTGVNGQNNLFRQFYGQIHKEGLIIDERWNGGGQIPTRFIELLNRPRTNYWAVRHGRDWPWPPDSHQGPKCMLINGLAGSGGDMFPWLFKQAGVGKTIGTRTWGGLVGISGNPGLIDGASVTAPTFAFYEKDGTWGVEGHGVDPDIEVIDDPAKMLEGGDPQLDAAIAHMLAEIEKSPYRPPQRPPYPNRKGMGLDPKDR
jgi:tricorn protease-like protein/C-terminal processing protease CtpA/Prc